MPETAIAARQDRWRRKMMRALWNGDAEATLRASRRLLALDPNDADAHFFAGISALQTGQPEDAIGDFKRATALAPDRPDYWAHQAQCLTLMGRHADALHSVDRAAALPAADSLARSTIGKVLSSLGRHADAATHFEAAVDLSPDNVDVRYELAQALVYIGEIDRARNVCEQVLRIDPHHGRSHLVLADLLDGPPPAGRVEQLEAALANAAGNVDAELIVCQALARTLEAAGRTAEAFALWERSKLAKKTAVGYTIDADNAIFSALEQSFDANALADDRPGDPSPAPIFVVGMPRSGTTLVERILASHSAVAAGGELTYFAGSLSEAWGHRNDELIDAEAVDAALAIEPARLGARYLEQARLQVGEASRFVDKMPLNFFFVGFIRRALPNAKIVCLRRGALDTCLANFRQLFAQQYPQYRYALSLMDTAEYFSRFQRLMAHWDALYPGAVYHQSYERLVAEPAREIRRLLDYLALDFEPDVLRFDRNRAPVATASAVQVRRPLNSASVEAWRRYETELEPVRQRLIELGVEP